MLSNHSDLFVHKRGPAEPGPGGERSVTFFLAELEAQALVKLARAGVGIHHLQGQRNAAVLTGICAGLLDQVSAYALTAPCLGHNHRFDAHLAAARTLVEMAEGQPGPAPDRPSPAKFLAQDPESNIQKTRTPGVFQPDHADQVLPLYGVKAQFGSEAAPQEAFGLDPVTREELQVVDFEVKCFIEQADGLGQ